MMKKIFGVGRQFFFTFLLYFRMKTPSNEKNFHFWPFFFSPFLKQNLKKSFRVGGQNQGRSGHRKQTTFFFYALSSQSAWVVTIELYRVRTVLECLGKFGEKKYPFSQPGKLVDFVEILKKFVKVCEFQNLPD